MQGGRDLPLQCCARAQADGLIIQLPVQRLQSFDSEAGGGVVAGAAGNVQRAGGGLDLLTPGTGDMDAREGFARGNQFAALGLHSGQQLLKAGQFRGILQVGSMAARLLQGLLQGAALALQFPLGGLAGLHGMRQFGDLLRQRLQRGLLLFQFLCPAGDIRRRLLALLPLVSGVGQQVLQRLALFLLRAQPGLQAVDGGPALRVLCLGSLQFRQGALQAGNLRGDALEAAQVIFQFAQGGLQLLHLLVVFFHALLLVGVARLTSLQGEVAFVLCLHRVKQRAFLAADPGAAGGIVQRPGQAVGVRQSDAADLLALLHQQGVPQGHVHVAAEDLPGAVVGVVAGELFRPRCEDAQLGAGLAVVGLAVVEVVVAAADFGGDAAAHVLPHRLHGLYFLFLRAGLFPEQHAQGLHQGGLADLVGALDQGDGIVEFDVACADAAPVFQGEGE